MYHYFVCISFLCTCHSELILCGSYFRDKSQPECGFNLVEDESVCVGDGWLCSDAKTATGDRYYLLQDVFIYLPSLLQLQPCVFRLFIDAEKCANKNPLENRFHSTGGTRKDDGFRGAKRLMCLGRA